MSILSNSGTDHKITKCKSLDNFSTHTNTPIYNLNHNINPTRPKFQQIRPKIIPNTSQNKPYNLQTERLTRIKSLDQLQKIRQSTIYENMVQIYRKENQNLKQQNKYLIKQVKKRQKNQETLTNYIAQLHKQIKILERNKSRQPIICRSKINSFKGSKINNQQQYTQRQGQGQKLSVQSKGGMVIDQGDTWNTMYQIQELNDRFNILMEQCSKQICSKNRRVIREKLAETAQKMKNFRKDIN